MGILFNQIRSIVQSVCFFAAKTADPCFLHYFMNYESRITRILTQDG